MSGRVPAPGTERRASEVRITPLLKKLFKSRQRRTRVVAMERRQWLLGMLATTLVLVIWWAGYLNTLEQQFHDFRARWCWFYSDPPSDRIVVIAMDDPTINTVGRWPWPRERLAVIIDELRRAGAASVALDLLLDDPEEPRQVPRVDPQALEFPQVASRERPEKPTGSAEVDGDDEFARSIESYGQVVLATAFSFEAISGGESGVEDQKSFNVPLSEMLEFVGGNEQFRKAYVDAREATPEAARPSSWKYLGASEEEAANTLLPELVEHFAKVAYRRGTEFNEVRRKYSAARVLLNKAKSCSIPAPPEMRDWARSVEPRPVIERLGARAQIGNVTFDSFDSDGKTRRIPLWVEHDGRLWPTLGLAAVLAYWGVDASVLSIEGDQTVIKVPGKEVRRIPMMRSLVRRRVVDGLVYVPWPRGTLGKEQVLAKAGAAPPVPGGVGPPMPRPGGGVASLTDWEFQFFDTGRNESALVSAGRVYEPQLQREQIVQNIISITIAIEKSMVAQELVAGPALEAFREAVRVLLAADADEINGSAWRAKFQAFKGAVQGADKEGESVLLQNADVVCAKLFEPLEGQQQKIDDLAKELIKTNYEELAKRHGFFAGVDDPAELQKLKAAIDGLVNIQEARRTIQECLREIAKAEDNIREIREDLSRRIRGKIAFFGWIATGVAADFVTTSIHPKTPGVMVHVAIADAVLRNHWEAVWPQWAEVGVIVILGLGGTWTGVRSSVVVAPITVGVIVLSWFALNGVVLWDINLRVASLSGPWVAASAGWLTVLLHRLLVEQRDRKVTEERFKSYVSPAVVDILVNNPELAMMKPSMREMTVMFSDLADFTTTSERLGPVLLAKCLSKYLKEMTEILQKNKGTLDKYLGDGIMCFWNAPIADAQHARHGCQTAVQMIKRLEEINETGGFEEAGRLKVRIGVCTGQCMVGDFGNPPRNSNYTLLGDTANFAARLESANKFFGTRILATQRVRDQAGPDVRWRTIGKVFVKGKKEADMLYELIGPLEPHGPATDEWIELSDGAVADYAANRFDACLKKFDLLARRFGDTKLAEIYGEAIESWKARPDYPASFDGAIVLTEK